MKIKIELEVGEMTGAIVGMLTVGIKSTIQNVKILRECNSLEPEKIDLLNKAVQLAEQVNNDIQSKVDAISY